jgi:hypothetical protein
MRYNVADKTKTVLTSLSSSVPISLEAIPGDQNKNLAVLLSKDQNSYNLTTLNLVSGTQSNKIIVSDFTPSLAYYVNDNFYILVGGADQRQLISIDAAGTKLWQVASDQKIVAIADDSDQNNIYFATFDGSGSVIHHYTRQSDTKSDMESYSGQIYKFDQNRVLYSAKTVLTDNTADPAGQAQWQISTADRINKSSQVLSAGPFDLNAVALNNDTGNNSYNFIAYQSLSDLNQSSGTIYLKTNSQQNMSIDNGIPLLIY